VKILQSFTDEYIVMVMLNDDRIMGGCVYVDSGLYCS